MPKSPNTDPTYDPELEDRPDRESPPLAGKKIGPYLIEREIGRGGMGVVYMAVQPALKRTVALKVLIAGEDASQIALARFQHEAEAVAKLGHHPNIVPVFDIGREGNLHYFAMHFVQGESLETLIDQGEITPRMAASFTRRVAEGLAHAHTHGVLHRDIKPANILLANRAEVSSVECSEFSPETVTKHSTPNTEHSSGTDFVPMLTDFGLAKTVESESSLTRSGSTLGTPQYMPPEQADGRLRDVDERSDVYSLGASLYEMLTFSPPFMADTVVGVIQQVLLTDPVPPRKKNLIVDVDLETICMKCLEKDPDRRYEDARALADDLSRYLAGDAILARPASLLYRLKKLARRHRALVATASVFMFLLLVSVAVGAVVVLGKEAEKRKASRRAETAENRAETAEDRADTAEDRAETAEGEAEHATARMNREALLREKNAKVAKVMMAGQARFFMRHRKLKAFHYDATRVGKDNEAFLSTQRKEIDAFFDVQLSRDISILKGPERAGQSATLALQGWLLRLLGKEKEALDLFGRARETDPDVGWGFLFEAMTCLSRYLADQELPNAVTREGQFQWEAMSPDSRRMRAARERCLAVLERLGSPSTKGAAGEWVWGTELSEGFASAVRGLPEIFSKDFARAEKALTAILALPEFFWMEEEILRARTSIRFVLMDFDGAEADARAFLERAPDSAHLFNALGDIYKTRGQREEFVGKDPVAAYEESIRLYTESIRRNPNHGEAPYRRGHARHYLGRRLMKMGADPRSHYSAAIEDFEKASEITRGSASSIDSRGTVLLSLGKYEDQIGLDPIETLEEAIDVMERAVALDSGAGNFQGNLGTAYSALASILQRRGKDPWKTYQKSIRAFEGGLKADVSDTSVHNNMGSTFEKMGNFLSWRGKDPRPFFEKSLEAFGESLRLFPRDAYALNGRGKTFKSLGVWQVIAGKDSSEALTRSIAEFDRALEINPEAINVWNNRGVASLKLGEARNRLRADPFEAYEEAVRSFKKALETNPRFISSLNNMANAYQSTSLALEARGKDPRPTYLLAIEAYTRALAVNPEYVFAHFNRGNAYRRLGNTTARSGEDPREYYRKAIEGFDEALRRNPRYSRIYPDRGFARASLGEAEAKWGEDPRPYYTRAVKDFEEGVRLNPRDWRALRDVAFILHDLGLHEKEVEALNRALDVLRRPHEGISSRLKRARVIATAPPWIRRLLHADFLIRIGATALAREAYEEALKLVAEGGGMEKLRKTQIPGFMKDYPSHILSGAHYNLACSRAQASVGKKASKAKPEAVPAKRAAALRAEAIEALGKALDLGFPDREALRKDTDLDPLREMPDFKALLGK